MEKPVTLTADELISLPLFRELPYKFLAWHTGAVRRMFLKRNDEVFREGEYGDTACIVEKGMLLEETRGARWKIDAGKTEGLVSRLLGHRALSQLSRLEAPAAGRGPQVSVLGMSGGTRAAIGGHWQHSANPERVLDLGACLNNYPRGATLTSVTDDTAVLVLERDIVLALLRVPRCREKVLEDYRREFLRQFLVASELFRSGPGVAAPGTEQALDAAERIVEFERVRPGQLIFRAGEPANDLYLVRLGFVALTEEEEGARYVYDYVGPNGMFGYLGFVARHAPDIEVLWPAGRKGRPVSARALDWVELVRVPYSWLESLAGPLREVLLSTLEKAARQQIRRYWGDAPPRSASLTDFAKAGLLDARELLVLDLEKCTRCDECTRACADSHEGVSRLYRMGERAGKFLVASACRSCMNPYCMACCPVNAIHREGVGREVVVQPHCIGCEACVKACPYGNITIDRKSGVDDYEDDSGSPVREWVDVRKAVLCDFCKSIGGTPRCVYACPHDAADRKSGKKVWDAISGGTGS